jgi:hypothetical protein
MLCATTQTDRNNCGGCNVACKATESCTAGVCTPAMCKGTPGAPVNPSDEDGGVSDEDAGSLSSGPGEPQVIGPNGCAPNEDCTTDGMTSTCRCGTTPSCPLDQQCSTGGMCKCGSGPGCMMGQGCCGDACIDVQTDSNNCGGCGNVCEGGTTCKAGKCACPIAADISCGGTCRKAQTDEQNCGTCGNVCAEGATCELGKCACKAGEVACDGKCVVTTTDANCGACGNSCDAPSICRDPSGTLPLGCYCPNINEIPCNGVCVALGTVDNCGACDDACTSPTSSCKGTTGNYSCQCPTAGQIACGASCVNLAVGKASTSPIEDCGECGLTCLAGATCAASECSCPSASTTDKYCDENINGATDGNYSCVEVTSTKNCGDCGSACLDDSICNTTPPGTSPANFACKCVNTDAGKTHCPGQGCITLTNDDKNCGACGKVCATGESCCGGSCVNKQSDEKNCGACGTDCADSFCLFRACNCNSGICN